MREKGRETFGRILLNKAIIKIINSQIQKKKKKMKRNTHKEEEYTYIYIHVRRAMESNLLLLYIF